MPATKDKPAAQPALDEAPPAEAPPPARARDPKPVADSLHAKIAEVQSEIGVMPPDRHVDTGKYEYDYLSESALMSAVRSKLALRGVAVYVSTFGQRREGNLTFVETSITFADGATGETFTVTGQGQGSDNSDKGVYKAITGAVRYMLWKTFLVPTEGDDPNQPHEIGAARDAPVTITEVINRLDVFVEDSKLWIKEAIEGFYSKPDEPLVLAGAFTALPARVQLNSLARLQLAVLDLEDDRKAFDTLKNPEDQQSRVRGAFARAFGGLAVLGPDPFKPAIPF